MEFRTFQKQWGAEFISDDVVRFRVWAEGQKALTLRLAVTDVPMTPPPMTITSVDLFIVVTSGQCFQ